MNNPKLKICNKSPHDNPNYAKPGDSGMDLRAWIFFEDVSDSFEEVKLSPESNVPYIKDVCIPCCMVNEGKATLGVELAPLTRVLIHTGIYVEIPYGYEIQVRTKSGQALKKGLVVLNTPGTVKKI